MSQSETQNPAAPPMTSNDDHTATRSGLISFSLVFFYVALSITYVTIVGPKWGTMAFRVHPNMAMAGASIALTFAYPYFAPLRRDAGSLILLFTFATFYVPSLVLLSFHRFDTQVCFALAISLPTVILFSKLPAPKIKVRTISPSRAFTICLAISLLALFAVAGRVGTSTFSLDLMSVYEYRALVAHEVGGLNRIISIVTKAILPLALMYAVAQRSWRRILMLLASAIPLIGIFGLWHHKSVILVAPALALVYWLSHRGDPIKRISVAFILAGGILFLNLANTIATNGAGWTFLTDLLIRRALFLPVLLNYHYLDYYEHHDKVLWAGDLTGVASGVAPATQIGIQYFGSAATTANTGFIGSGFANAGLIGVLIYSAALGCIISYINRNSSHLGAAFAFAVVAFPIQTAFTTADLIVTLLSSGLLVSLMILPFLSAPDDGRTSPVVRRE